MFRFLGLLYFLYFSPALFAEAEQITVSTDRIKNLIQGASGLIQGPDFELQEDRETYIIKTVWKDEQAVFNFLYTEAHTQLIYEFGLKGTKLSKENKNRDLNLNKAFGKPVLVINKFNSRTKEFSLNMYPTIVERQLPSIPPILQGGFVGFSVIVISSLILYAKDHFCGVLLEGGPVWWGSDALIPLGLAGAFLASAFGVGFHLMEIDLL